jgi:hypothetical protein
VANNRDHRVTLADAAKTKWDTRHAKTQPPPAIDPDKARWAKQLRDWAGQMLAHANELEETR